MPVMGWDERWDALMRAEAALSGAELALARVSGVHRGAFDVMAASPQGAPGDVAKVGLSDPRHARDQEEWPPVVGDWVVLDREGAVRRILPRRSLLERPSVSRDSVRQRIAANVDVALVVEPLVPEPSLGRIERLVAIALSAGIEPWIVLTKADLVGPEVSGPLAGELECRFGNVRVTSDRDPGSVQALLRDLPDGATAILLGRSGGGKSTLTNLMLGTSQRVQQVRESDHKGRHTTTGRHLISGERLVVIDNPGIRAIGAAPDPDSIDRVFPDIAELAAACRFSNCTHTSEPGCAVIRAVEDGIVDVAALDRYERMQREARRTELRQDARLAREAERGASRDGKAGRRAMMRNKGRR